MEKIIATIIAVASIAAAYLFGRKSGSGSNDRQRNIRGALDDIRETAEEMGDAGNRTSTVAAEIRDIGEGLGDAVTIAKSDREDAQRQDELIGELNRRNRRTKHRLLRSGTLSS